MAQTTAFTGQFRDYMGDGDIVPVNMSGTALTVTKGDAVAWSAAYGMAVNTGIAWFRASAVGIALANNPWSDELNVQRPNTALPVLTRGVIRVSAAASSYSNSAGFDMGVSMAPVTTGSGIVGQTGATGIGAVWQNVPRVGISASVGALTALLPSGIATYVEFVKGGIASAGQINIYINGVNRPDYL